MQRDDQIRLRHMLEAAKDALSFAENETRSSLEADRKLELALVKSIEIIGEAAANMTDDCRRTLPGIPWASITGMRNRLVHVYFDVDRDILWKTITEDLPSLIAELEKVLPSE
jgi:uncharacterized protein with HEPN domain